MCTLLKDSYVCSTPLAEFGLIVIKVCSGSQFFQKLHFKVCLMIRGDFLARSISDKPNPINQIWHFRIFLHVLLTVGTQYNTQYTISYTIHNTIPIQEPVTILLSWLKDLSWILNHVNKRSMWILQCMAKVWYQFFFQCMLVKYCINALSAIQEIHFNWRV